MRCKQRVQEFIGGGGFVALLHEIGRKTCRKRDKQGGNRLGLFTRKKKDNAPENRPVPRHIAVIMDGNGRWAKKRGLPRKAGHKVGAETFRTIATYCKDIGVQYFTVYAFSTENWKRPQDEVDALLNLFRSYLKEAAETMFERGVAVRVLGDLTVLPEDIRAQIAEVDEIADRLGPDAATASLCINYGGRDEIKNAVRAIAEQVKNGELAPEDITEDTITANLYTAHMPDPDLIIRPSGEIRTSNFLLWQSAYSEYYFTDVLWPDFKTTDLDAAIDNFNNRNRRFGGVVGGAVLVLIAAVIMNRTLDLEMPLWSAVVLGAVGAVLGEIGDLSFSVIKRQTGIKDYGHIFPGHGGVLDRFDSVLFVAPFAELLFRVIW